MQAITMEELQDKLASQGDNDLLLIGVFDPENFLQKHIPGSVNIPLAGNGRFAREVEKIAGSKERHIVVYCESRESDASDQAGEKLEDAGFLNVFDFEGGLKAWEENAGQLAQAT